MMTYQNVWYAQDQRRQTHASTLLGVDANDWLSDIIDVLRSLQRPPGGKSMHPKADYMVQGLKMYGPVT